MKAKLEAITPALIATACAMNDLDDAVASLMKPAEITEGGCASRAFGGSEGDEWPTATVGQRESMLQNWIELERDMEVDYAPPK